MAASDSKAPAGLTASTFLEACLGLAAVGSSTQLQIIAYMKVNAAAICAADAAVAKAAAAVRSTQANRQDAAEASSVSQALHKLQLPSDSDSDRAESTRLARTHGMYLLLVFALLATCVLSLDLPVLPFHVLGVRAERRLHRRGGAEDRHLLQISLEST